jgi:hypothetical protein
MDFGPEENLLEGTQGAVSPRAGSNLHLSVCQLLSNIKHNFHIKSPEQALHKNC